MPDIIEDIFAFMLTSGDRKNGVSGDSSSTCPTCGAEMEYDEDTDEMKCPDCN